MAQSARPKGKSQITSIMNLNSKIRKIDAKKPDRDVIEQAAQIIREGGVVIFPTRGLYGLAADAFNPAAVEKIFNIKNRSFDKPILILFRSIQGLDSLVQTIPAASAALMANFWPGKITIVFKASDTVPTLLTAGTGKIGIRLPGYRVASLLVEATGGPITGTSANISGDGGCAEIDAIDSAVLEQADIILDAGRLKGGKGSTVVDVTVDPPLVLRDGAIPADDIYKLLNLYQGA